VGHGTRNTGRDEKRPTTLTGPPAFAREVEGGIELRIKVVPGASRSEIAGVLGDRLKVRVAAPAESGKANRAAIELLQKWLGVRKVEIVGGLSSPEKTVRVEVSEPGPLLLRLTARG
jgi:uncharacterized protein (TIGR00251 family)